MFTGSYICTSFYTGLLNGDFDFGVDTFKMALYDDTATLTAATTAYTTSGEITGTNYTAGGATVTVAVTTQSTQNGTVVIVTPSNGVWAAATFTARGAMIYDDTAAGNPAWAILDFGSNKSCAASTFTVQTPAATANAGFMVLATVLGQ